MFKLLLVLFALISLCVVIHGVGMTLGIRWLGREWREVGTRFGRARTFWLLIRVVYGLLLLHTLEIVVWAILYRSIGCFPDFETSFYYSATSYSTVGYGDVVPVGHWRILGSMEAVTGVLMFGWSTGALFTVAQHLQSRFAQVPVTSQA